MDLEMLLPHHKQKKVWKKKQWRKELMYIQIFFVESDKITY